MNPILPLIAALVALAVVAKNYYDDRSTGDGIRLVVLSIFIIALLVSILT